jgi:hypothetical protein
VLIDSVGALLLISDDAKRLAAFYRDALGPARSAPPSAGIPANPSARP